MHKIVHTNSELRIGSLVSMAQLHDDASVIRDYPILTESLWQAASQQLRNMARLGGNVLQRTRCSYFRDTSYDQCNKRSPGSGCAALEGANRGHAVLGTSDQCIAVYPSDWAPALIALDAQVEVLGKSGKRTVAFEHLHRLPGTTPHIETNLAPGELITAFIVPGGPRRRSLYRKIRDRQSYEFANASAAVAIDLDGEVLRDVRIGLGGVATVPWRARRAESLLRGRKLTEVSATAAAEAEFKDARTRKYNAFKVVLGKQTMVRALLEAQAMEIS
jgi:xanthine dehydrogenase YagS FAD-binding subunit